MRRFGLWIATSFLLCAATACGGGGAVAPGGTPPNGTSPNAASPASYALNASSPTTVPLPTAAGIAGTVTFPAASGSLTMTAATSASDTTSAQIRSKLSSGTLDVYYTLTVKATTTVSLSTLPAFTMTIPATTPVAGQSFYYGVSNPNATTPGVSYQTQGPATVNGFSLAFPTSSTPEPLTIAPGQSYSFIFYSTSNGSTSSSLYFIDTKGNINVVPTTATGTAVAPTFSIPSLGLPTYEYPVTTSLAVDNAGTIYAPGAGTNVNIFPRGSKTPSRSIKIPDSPHSVAINKDGSIYVLGSDGTNSTLYVYQPNGTTPLRTIAGVNTQLTANPQTTGGVSDAVQVAVDANYNAYVASAIDSRLGDSQIGVLEFPAFSNGDPTTPLVTNGYGFLRDPQGIYVTPDGNTIYLAVGVAQIAVFTRSGSVFNLSKELGVTPFSGPGTDGPVNYESVTVDANGVVYGLESGSSPATVDVFAAGAANGAAPSRTFTTTFAADSLTAAP